MTRARLRRGFTMIELLIVVLVIGILASIAIVKFTSSKERAYLASMKSDLHAIAIVAESKFETDGTYANLTAPSGSPGVTLLLDVSSASWKATATHASLPAVTCTLSVGGAGEQAQANDVVCQ